MNREWTGHTLMILLSKAIECAIQAAMNCWEGRRALEVTDLKGDGIDWAYTDARAVANRRLCASGGDEQLARARGSSVRTSSAMAFAQGSSVTAVTMDCQEGGATGSRCEPPARWRRG